MTPLWISIQTNEALIAYQRKLSSQIRMRKRLCNALQKTEFSKVFCLYFRFLLFWWGEQIKHKCVTNSSYSNTTLGLIYDTDYTWRRLKKVYHCFSWDWRNKYQSYLSTCKRVKILRKGVNYLSREFINFLFKYRQFL